MIPHESLKPELRYKCFSHLPSCLYFGDLQVSFHSEVIISSEDALTLGYYSYSSFNVCAVFMYSRCDRSVLVLQ